MRFMCTLGDTGVERFVASVELPHVYGFFVSDALIASSMVMPDGSNRVEFAVSVDAEHRGRGLSRQMLDHGLECIWADRVGEVAIRHIKDNYAMAALHRHLPSTRQYESGEVDVLINLEQLRAERHDAMSRLVGEEV